jgi:hypothetical protein
MGLDLSFDELIAKLVNVTVNSTLGLFESTAKTPTVKRIALTSSPLGIIAFQDAVFNDVDTIYTAESTTPVTHGPYSHHFEAYASAKGKVLYAAKEFIREGRPGFDVVYVLPSYVIGENEMTTSVGDMMISSASAALAQALGLEWVLCRCRE